MSVGGLCCSKCVCFVCKMLCDIVWIMFGVLLCLWIVVRGLG